MMFKRLLIGIACLTVPTLTSPAYSQETNIMIGIPAERFSRFNQHPVEGLNISTAQIDPLIANKVNTINPILFRFGLTPRRTQFPRNFTRDLINEAFGELDQLRRGLERSLTIALTNQDDVRRVRRAQIGKGEVGVRLSQAGTSFTALISGFSASVVFEANRGLPIICPSPDISVDLGNITATTTYNVFTGALMNTDVNFVVRDVDTDCGNPIGNLGVAIFGSGARSRITQELNNQVNSISSMVNMQELFSIRDFIEGARGAITTAGANFINERQANMAFDAALQVFGTANLNTGLQIDLKLFDSSNPAVPNRFTLAASHQAPTRLNIAQNGPENVVFAQLPSRTRSMEIFFNTRFAASTTRNFYRANPAPAEGTRVQVVGISSFIPGLRSFPTPYSSLFEAPGPATCGSRQCDRRGR